MMLNVGTRDKTSVNENVLNFPLLSFFFYFCAVALETALSGVKLTSPYLYICKRVSRVLCMMMMKKKNKWLKAGCESETCVRVYFCKYESVCISLILLRAVKKRDIILEG
jgi:hypothetical protein